MFKKIGVIQPCPSLPVYGARRQLTQIQCSESLASSSNETLREELRCSCSKALDRMKLLYSWNRRPLALALVKVVCLLSLQIPPAGRIQEMDRNGAMTITTISPAQLTHAFENNNNPNCSCCVIHLSTSFSIM